MGVETLRLYIDECLKPRSLTVRFEPTKAIFTGIDGRPEPGLAVCTFPLGVPGLQDTSFRTDLIGGSGSHCPGLLPMPVLMAYSSCLMCGVLQHNDGILILTTELVGKRVVAFVRVLLTESGHYMMPMDQFNWTDRQVKTE